MNLVNSLQKGNQLAYGKYELIFHNCFGLTGINPQLCLELNSWDSAAFMPIRS